MVRACDYVLIEDEAGGYPPETQPIVGTSYSHDSLSVSCELGLPAPSVEALLARLAARTPDVSDDLAIPDLGGHRLEVGCGSRARAAKGARRTYVGVDAHEPYLAEAHRRYPSRIFMLAGWRPAMEMFEAELL